MYVRQWFSLWTKLTFKGHHKVESLSQINLTKIQNDWRTKTADTYEVCPESIGLPLYLRAGVILHHRAGGILQSNPT